ncbi:MmgE/PrpD family protein [Mesorhizobium koreense]|uniref:MmgE/PrpD family protein n=1 Tax=Mesorhizobium koreense TaxID=3074855 RepID=UPI00287BA799|nr:MmgE/PrpD family protein [Mesorhizobium sp. WR6]
MSLSRVIVERLGRLAESNLPEDVADVAKLHLLDVAGVGLAAAGSSAGRPYRNYAKGLSAAGPCTILGQAGGFSASDAALVNGGLIHSLEFDDTHTGSIVHGSSVLASTAIAGGEAFRASGKAVLGAYARWYEVFIRIGLAAAGSFQDRGFQLTSVGGTLCAAGIAAELAGADEETTVAALGIALSQASGVFEFLSNGSTVKSLHPGWAAHSGITAFALARAGLTGPETSFEGRFGLFSAFAGDRNASDRLRENVGSLGLDWHIRDVAFKFHPCCHYLHPFIEAAGTLADGGVRAEMIEEIECRVPAGAAGIICEPWSAKQAARDHAMRWSLPAVVAARFVHGQVDTTVFERELSPEARQLAGRIIWTPLREADFPARFEAEIHCRLRSGDMRSARVEDAYGNRSRPAGAKAVEEKFRKNLLAAGGDAAIGRITRSVHALDAMPSLDDFGAALRSAAPRTERNLP